VIRAAGPAAGRSPTQRNAWAVLLVSCLPLTALASTAGDPVEPTPTPPDPIQPIVTLRDSGYLLGDVIDERVDLNLPAGVSLDPDSLPLPGRVAPWMEVRSSRIDHGEQGGGQSVIVRYQIFAEVEQTERVPIPAGPVAKTLHPGACSSRASARPEFAVSGHIRACPGQPSH